MVWTFLQIFTCMLSRQTLKLGYLDTTYVFSGEVETLSCYRSDAMIMKFLSEQFVLKLCQMDNLCQSWGKLKLLLMKINFTFSGGQKLRIFGRSWNFLTSQFWNLEHFFWNFVRIIICKISPQYLTFMPFKWNEDNLNILWRTKLTNFRKVMKLSQITVLKLRAIFLKLCQNNYMQEISPIFDSFLFHSFWYNQVIRVMSKKLPTLPRGSLSIKCLNLSRDSSMPR